MKEAWERRLQKYQSLMSKNEKHAHALQACLLHNNENLTQEAQLFLHVFAPAMVEYVEWVLQEAVRNKKKRLFFLARDGYYMYLVAKIICQYRQLNIECRYLKVSRYSMRCAEYHLMGKKCLDLICVGGIDITFEKIMKRSMLTDMESLEVAGLCGYTDDYRKTLNYQKVQELKVLLCDVPQFFTYVKQHSKAVYPQAMGYLEQEGLLESIPYAIVDSGWVGTLQASMEKLLQSKKKDIHLEGYYFGLYETPRGVDKRKYHGFFFEPSNHIRRKVHFSNCLFETVFSAPEGMTTGYQLTEKGYEAVESENRNPNAARIQKNQKLLEQYLEVYLKQETVGSMEYNGIYTETLLNTLMGKPEQWEVKLFGNQQFCDDVLESQMQPVAAQLSEEEIRKQRFFSKILIMLNIKKEEMHESAWLEGSIVRNGGHINQNLRHAVLCKYFIYIRKALARK